MWRYDMQNKTPQQRAIVAQADRADAIRQAESKKSKCEIAKEYNVCEHDGKDGAVMNCFCGSINANGKWDIFDFSVGETDSFFAHSKMVPGDIIVLVVGKQNPKVLSGAYVILKCISDIYKEEVYGKFRNRINAKCIYHSGFAPFISRDDLEKYIHFPIRVPVQVKNGIDGFSDLVNAHI